MGSLREDKVTLDDVREWLQKVDRNYDDNSNDFYLMDNKNGTFRIDAGLIGITTLETELPYEFVECDTFGISAPNLKSLKNFPSKSMHNSTVEFYFGTCNALDFANSMYALPPCDINLDNMPNIHLTDFENLSFSSQIKTISFMYCENPKLYDVSTYDTEIRAMYMGLNSKIKNLTSILTNKNCKLQFLRFSCNSKMLGFKAVDFNNIIAKYIDKSNKSNYVMDMTLELIDSGFEDEV